MLMPRVNCNVTFSHTIDEFFIVKKHSTPKRSYGWINVSDDHTLCYSSREESDGNSSSASKGFHISYPCSQGIPDHIGHKI